MLATSLGGAWISLGPGCRDFNDPGHETGAAGSPEAGAPSAEPAAGAGGQIDETGGTGNAGDGNYGLAGDSAGAGGSPDIAPVLDVTVSEYFVLQGTWSALMPFVHKGRPHYIMHSDETGQSALRRLQDGFVEDVMIDWSALGPTWAGALTFSRVARDDVETFALYWPEDGTRQLMGFDDVSGSPVPVQLDSNDFQIGPGITHQASGVAASGSFLYWYDENNTRLIIDMVNVDGDEIVSQFTTQLPRTYHALAALEGRLMGFWDGSADVWNVSALLGGNTTPTMTLEGLGQAQRVLLFTLGEVSLLFYYDLIGQAWIRQLRWSSEHPDREVWNSAVLPLQSVQPDLLSFSAVALPSGEVLIFGSHDRFLQLFSVKLE
jgi:hypothetical protein